VSPVDEERVGLPDEAATDALGARLATRVRAGDVVLLEGPLGAGKTTLVRAMVAALGGDPNEVCSPTFVIQESYAIRGPGLRRLHHLDLYRLRGRPGAAFHEVGLLEAIEDPEAVTAVEWPEELGWQATGTLRGLRVVLAYEGDGRSARVGVLG